jgi:hypothetical protein
MPILGPLVRLWLSCSARHLHHLVLLRFFLGIILLALRWPSYPIGYLLVPPSVHFLHDFLQLSALQVIDSSWQFSLVCPVRDGDFNVVDAGPAHGKNPSVEWTPTIMAPVQLMLDILNAKSESEGLSGAERSDYFIGRSERNTIQ